MPSDERLWLYDHQGAAPVEDPRERDHRETE